MYAPYGPFFAIMPEMLPKNVSGQVTALVNSCGALGGFVGRISSVSLRPTPATPAQDLYAVSLILPVIIRLRGRSSTLCLHGPLPKRTALARHSIRFGKGTKLA